jgi:hypothetical protein
VEGVKEIPEAIKKERDGEAKGDEETFPRGVVTLACGLRSIVNYALCNVRQHYYDIIIDDINGLCIAVCYKNDLVSSCIHTS